MTEFSSDERKNVIRDIAHWKVELEYTGGREFSDEAFSEYLDELVALSDSDLESWWWGSVGEWVASRHDMPLPEDMSHEEWLNKQFDRLKAGEDVPWGYVVPVSIERAVSS